MAMITFSSVLALLLPGPALRDAARVAQRQRGRRRAIAALRLAPHLLRDVGLDDFEAAADDPRWVRRYDLER